MAFDTLSAESMEHGSLGSKAANISKIPETVVKVIDMAWQHTQDHPDQFHKVTLANKAERDEFHLYGKAAAKAHDPVLDYRKLPRPGERDDNIAYFTLRLLTADTPRPGRKPAESTPATPSASEQKDDKGDKDKGDK